MPLLGLLPVVVAVGLAREGFFGAPGAVAPVATATLAPLAANVAATPVSNAPGAGQAQPAQPLTAATQVATQTSASPSSSTGTPGNATASGAARAAAPQPTAVPQNPNAGEGLFRAYRVQPGDTVKFVAEMFGVSPASVAQASGLLNADRVQVGQILTVPIQPGWLYRVQSGETLDLIAARTGVRSEIILSASKLANDTVRPGDVILIPDQSVARSK